mgnify:FL=1
MSYIFTILYYIIEITVVVGCMIHVKQVNRKRENGEITKKQACKSYLILFICIIAPMIVNQIVTFVNQF